MKKIIALLLMLRAFAALAVLVILVLAFNASWEHLRNAQDHLSNAGDELSTLAGDISGSTQNVVGVFERVADSADDIADVLAVLPSIPSINTSIDIDIPTGFIRTGLSNFRIPTPTISNPLRTRSLLTILEDVAEIDIPFASTFNAFRNSFNPMIDNLQDSLNDISLMGESMDTVTDELQLANNDLVAAASALNNLPFGLGNYLPTLIVGFFALWLITAFFVDLQRGLDLFFGN